MIMIGEERRVRNLSPMFASNGKSRVILLKPVTIPGLELTAALVSSKIICVLLKELEYYDLTETFWIGSKPILGYSLQTMMRNDLIFLVATARSRNSRADLTLAAEISSHGAGAHDIIESFLGWNGPDFL